MASVVVRHNHLTQRQNTVRERVAVMPIRQCLAPGLDDVVRRLKIRLADAQVDDVVPSPLQFACARRHPKGGFEIVGMSCVLGCSFGLARRCAVWPRAAGA